MEIGGLLKNVVGAVAPTIGTALGGPMGGMAANMISEVLGCKNDAKSIEKAIESATPEQMLELKKAEQALELQMKEYSNKEKLTTNFWKRQYVNNCFVHNSSLTDKHYNIEEMKLINENDTFGYKKLLRLANEAIILEEFYDEILDYVKSFH